MAGISNKYYKLVLDDTNGAISSFINTTGKEFICTSDDRCLFELHVLDNNGDKSVLSSNNATCKLMQGKNITKIYYNNIGGQNISATARISYDSNSPFVRFTLQVNNHSNLHLDKIDYPQIVVPNDLVATGGKSHVFTPMMEGAVVDDIEIREKTYMGYHDVGYPACGWEGIYPGATPMQFMAYYDDDGNGMYFASHDKDCNPKVVELHKAQGGIKLEYQLFPGVDDTSDFNYGYDVVLGTFLGNWYDAAEIYRNFVEQSGIISLPKLKDNNNVPTWLKDSPVVVCYPVRGEVDSHFEETSEYYPYTKATNVMLKLNEQLDSKVMPLLMHWEGTAPWAPPYVWPPYGDYNDFMQYIKDMHDSGNYIGVYCSGIAWTQQSMLAKSYNRRDDFDKLGIDKIIIRGPKHDTSWSNVCGSVGLRHDMCPSCEATCQIACDEFEKIIFGCDVDYIQFFDQILGGNTYACYDTSHGHCFGPGKWQTQSMHKLLNGMKSILTKYGKQRDVLIGCEGNAAEPFVNDYVFNDSRHNINYFFANPVPAYNYVFHEYVSNFMGNQNTSSYCTDYSKYPDNVYMRYAHSFVQGDIITVVLKDKGKIHWDWCTPWNAPEIAQDEIVSYIKLLNAWRKGVAKDVLCYGRMVKPLDYTCDKYCEDIIYGGKHVYNSVESACYVVDGVKYQLFVNYLNKTQTVQVHLPSQSDVRLICDSNGNKVTQSICNEITLTLPARSVQMIIVE